LACSSPGRARGFWSGRGLGWLGRLPGDISYQSGDFRFYFPVTTCVLVSVVLTLLAWFFAAMKPVRAKKLS